MKELTVIVDGKNTLLTPSMILKQKIETNKKLKNSHLKNQISNK